MQDVSFGLLALFLAIFGLPLIIAMGHSMISGSRMNIQPFVRMATKWLRDLAKLIFSLSGSIAQIAERAVPASHARYRGLVRVAVHILVVLVIGWFVLSVIGSFGRRDTGSIAPSWQPSQPLPAEPAPRRNNGGWVAPYNQTPDH